jgi:hypothetical protein
VGDIHDAIEHHLDDLQNFQDLDLQRQIVLLEVLNENIGALEKLDALSLENMESAISSWAYDWADLVQEKDSKFQIQLFDVGQTFLFNLHENNPYESEWLYFIVNIAATTSNSEILEKIVKEFGEDEFLSAVSGNPATPTEILDLVVQEALDSEKLYLNILLNINLSGETLRKLFENGTPEELYDSEVNLIDDNEELFFDAIKSHPNTPKNVLEDLQKMKK